jgi:PAS domain S-box-containing protein
MTGLSSIRNRRALFGILILSVFVGALFSTWWMVLRGDRELRAGLLQEARLVAQVMEIDRIKALAGTEADLGKPEYWRITEQVKSACSVNTGWRWLYLMGHRSDGTVFFYLDSEPLDSKDHALPGQVYSEALEPFHRVFDTGCPLVDGPYSDRWGTWVSALVPVSDPKTGEVLAVLGVDIDARAWNWNVAARTAIPIGLIFLVLIIAVAIFIATRQVDASPKPVMRRLLPPLASMVILMMAGAVALLWQQNQDGMREISADISRDFRNSIEQQAGGMLASMQLIVTDPAVKKALRERDTERLLALSTPIFEILGKNAHITHFYYSDTERVCLLRVHKPDERGDTISRFTAIKTERTGKSASGIELGPLGTLTLRVVQPVFENDILIGYMELGREIGELLKSLNTRADIKLALVIHKEFLNRQTWEESMHLLERQSDWDRLPDNVLVYASEDFPSDAFTSWAKQMTTSEYAHGETNRKIPLGKKDWQLASIPFPDASGKNVGALLIMEDLTHGKAAFTRLLIFGGTCGTILLALLLVFVYVLLRRTDAGIRAQQETLREERQCLADTIKAANLGTWEWNIQTGKAVFNEHWAKIIGYSLDEISPLSIETWLKFTHPDDLKASNELLEKYFRGELDHYECVARMRHKDGSWVQILDHGKITAWTGDGRPLLMRGTHTDITAHKRMEDMLRETNAYLENLITHANAPIIVWDPQFRITRFNHAFEILSGRSEAEVVNHSLEILFPPELTEDSMALIRATASGERWKTVEIKIQHSDKSVRTVLWNSATLFAADGRTPVATIAQGHDITERQRLETEKAEVEALLRQSQKMEAIGQLAGGVSHDFNNLLSVINGYAQILLMEPELSDDVRSKIEAIDQSGERAASLIRQLLMFSRRQPLESKSINLDTVISGIEKLLRRLIKADITMTRNITYGLWQIKADSGNIEQVIMNLAINASDAMPDGGALTVETGNVKIDEASHSSHPLDIKPGLYVMLSASDTGCGMDAKVMARIFEPFFTTKEAGKGTGLGLATVYGIVKQSNAHIDVQSEIGKGTRFRIYFPQSVEQDAMDAERPGTAAMPHGSETILLAEDENNLREMLQDFLQVLGYAVIPACNGKEALELVKNHGGEIHLLLTDIVMPGMKGAELAKYISDSFPKIKLLFMSGDTTQADTHKMLQITDNLIDKPINLHALAIKLREILDK